MRRQESSSYVPTPGWTDSRNIPHHIPTTGSLPNTHLRLSHIPPPGSVTNIHLSPTPLTNTHNIDLSHIPIPGSNT
ncbi:3783_t:CDS:1, partial [Dentiscutata heterogama]